jgi:hypothetical protein
MSRLRAARPGCPTAQLVAALLLAGLLGADAYMTNYACNTTYELVEKQNFTRTGEPGKIEFFCRDHVQYTAACDMDNDPYLGFNPSCNNTFAIQVFSNFQRALSVYSCKEYSRIWTCDNCTEAYKRWLCSALYRRCKQNDTEVSLGQCETNFTRTNSKALPDCIMKTCSDVCYDVVRKCPVHLAFRCPPLNDMREYNETNCNNMEREPPAASTGTTLKRRGLHALGMAIASLMVGLMHST